MVPALPARRPTRAAIERMARPDVSAGRHYGLIAARSTSIHRVASLIRDRLSLECGARSATSSRRRSGARDRAAAIAETRSTCSTRASR